MIVTKIVSKGIIREIFAKDRRAGMKKYFEYPINDKIKKDILDFYEDANVDMHNSQIKRKEKIKLERILNKVNFGEQDIVLDVGCSSGELLKLIHYKIKKGIGIDIASSIINANNEENQYENIDYKVFDGVHIKLENKVSKICMLDVLEHTFEPDALINSVYENLEEGGYLILEVPTTGWLSELIFGKYHMGHLRYYDPRSVRLFVEKHGFYIRDVTHYNSVPAGVYMLKNGDKFYRLMNMICNLIPARLYPYYGSVLVIASK